MTGPILIFLGPTLAVDAARRHLDATYLPPCRMGDVFRALETHRPRAIGIVDGYFEATPAVWHKEILYALSQGVAVFGASSMGALRAAELHPFGMEGVGAIFEAFAHGDLTDDDEVAVAHAEAAAGYDLASDPMVNLRRGLDLAKGASVIAEDDRTRIVAALKALPYPQRSWQAIWAGAGGLAQARLRALRDFVETTDCDLKAQDARALLDRIAEWDGAGRAAPKADHFDFEPTLFWEELMRLNRPEEATGGDGGQRLLDHVRVSPGREAALSGALLHHLVTDAVRRLGVTVPDDRVVLARFRRKRGLTSPAALGTWMADNRIDQAGCLDLARYEAQVRALLQRTMPSLGPDVAAALRVAGTYPAAEAGARRTETHLARAGIDDPGPDHVDALEPVLADYQRRTGPVHTDLDTHAAELGFGSTRHFLRALIGAHLAAESEEADDDTPARQHA
ncbi:TfuA-like protein [Roseivivax sediminis]|uniref:TfuA-like core domain-containing protein n=1 Tax=Roseivivax sediminis TaxID=936889 RepID=A0A1I1WAG4_9RHOB|nr:TfuA-like protein [Roseivivax sediminis]SFD92102.1 hypothetical protein SAMN04515678_104216 [Roseivivax sediminis]